MNSFDTFTITPMSAGDIIDRAARLYRRNFKVLLQIVLVPSLVAYAGSILLLLGVRNFSMVRGESRLVLTVLMVIGGGLLRLVGTAALFAVLGGASRTLVYHLFDGTPLRARAIYQAVREKLGPLILAIFVVSLVILAFGVLIYVVLGLLLVLFLFLASIAGGLLPEWLRLVMIVIFAVLTFAFMIVMILMLFSRIIYVPQVMMVEGKGVLSSIGRSFELAGGSLPRIGVIILFWTYVAWSLWLLLIFPLLIYGRWVEGDLNFFGDDVPFWFTIAQEALTQISQILIAPIVMLGFTLLYIDSRVRKEGFDVELLANRVLLPPTYPIPQAPLLDPDALRPVRDTGPLDDAAPTMEFNDEPPMTSTPELPAPSLPDSFDPAAAALNVPPVELPAALPRSETAVADDPAVQLQVGRRLCRWCRTEADVEDRFCRVCGALF